MNSKRACQETLAFTHTHSAITAVWPSPHSGQRLTLLSFCELASIFRLFRFECAWQIRMLGIFE